MGALKLLLYSYFERQLLHSNQTSKDDTMRRSRKTKDDGEDSAQDVLSNASSALDAAAQLAPLIPVPFVSSIFASAKIIVDCAWVHFS